jgi:hypothetical protein
MLSIDIIKGKSWIQPAFPEIADQEKHLNMVVSYAGVFVLRESAQG